MKATMDYADRGRLLKRQPFGRDVVSVAITLVALLFFPPTARGQQCSICNQTGRECGIAGCACSATGDVCYMGFCCKPLTCDQATIIVGSSQVLNDGCGGTITCGDENGAANGCGALPLDQCQSIEPYAAGDPEHATQTFLHAWCDGPPDIILPSYDTILPPAWVLMSNTWATFGQRMATDFVSFVAVGNRTDSNGNVI